LPRAILDGARFFGATGQAAMAFARERVIDAFESRGYVCRITHICDGMHSDGSLHYITNADDYGFRLIPEVDRQAIYQDVREALRADEPYSDFDVVYGDEKHQHHMHIEWQPKRALNK
jgi:hypothetical protein